MRLAYKSLFETSTWLFFCWGPILNTLIEAGFFWLDKISFNKVACVQINLNFHTLSCKKTFLLYSSELELNNIQRGFDGEDMGTWEEGI